MDSNIKMLKDFTESYIKKEEKIADFEFGFKVDEDWYTVNIYQNRTFSVKEEMPPQDAFSFISDSNTLQAIYSQNMTAMTAMGRAFWHESTPLDFINYNNIPQNINPLNFIFRYFILGEPEKVKLGKEHSRIVHGGYVIPLIYDKGLRTGWYRIEKDMIINEDEKEQVNPFSTLVVAVKGKGTVVIDGEKYKFVNGDAYYIPSNISHSFKTDSDDGLEFIIIMYGEGA